ncbi:MAG: hypothetical protein A2508_05620 [Candidatus Lambdaproteobacteria bacterium RIFOXYD12_FULL_49_8]|uniref:Putative regulatory protein FmdB zinc ribbon domain-containing protein n=1 Tax=Candidatus Lambdaproteobacteria bacterium RIFOXYD2_FULL_50_16 TaxID=1817772 RepID=A0A1F6G7E9_9PROT|nr:MAG: hypothetical protein A2527_09225 [Candidatus Lambdaproteobacteria bacterium RIFOXYD2_FULL_50_16]OGG98398.1 MAG: hypothetical protein A2508_05620 [Candidatus Lambdaproteobacteria bacterium RIFOXYD12_FULL_49_8]
MPLYEYQCQACGKQQELIRKIAEADDKTCPACGAEGLERQTSRTSFQLKGGGWYSDGYAAPASACEAAKPACKEGGCPAAQAS